MELERSQEATCIALNITKTYEGEIGIEGSQRSVQNVAAPWASLHSAEN